RARSWTFSTRRCNCSPRNRRACKPSSDTTLHWQNSTAPPARRAPTPRCSLTSRHTRHDRRPTTPAVVWTRKENQNKSRRPRCELRPEDPELPIRNRADAGTPIRVGSAQTLYAFLRLRETRAALSAFRTKCFGVRRLDAAFILRAVTIWSRFDKNLAWATAKCFRYGTSLRTISRAECYRNMSPLFHPKNSRHQRFA